MPTVTTTIHSVCADCCLYQGTGDPTFFDGSYCEPESSTRFQEVTTGLEQLAGGNGWLSVVYNDDIDLDDIRSIPCESCGTKLAGLRFELERCTNG